MNKALTLCILLCIVILAYNSTHTCLADIDVSISYEKIFNEKDANPKSHNVSMLSLSLLRSGNLSPILTGGIGVSAPFDGVTEHIIDLGTGLRKTIFGKGTSIGLESYLSIGRIHQKLPDFAKQLYFEEYSNSISARNTELGFKFSLFVEFDFRYYKSRFDIGYRAYPQFRKWEACSDKKECKQINRVNLYHPIMTMKGLSIKLTITL